MALDALTGEVKWRTKYDRAPYQSILGTGPRATPAIVGNRVYTCGITGVLCYFEAESGKQLWQVDMYRKVDGRLYVRDDKGVACLEVGQPGK